MAISLAARIGGLALGTVALLVLGAGGVPPAHAQATLGRARLREGEEEPASRATRRRSSRARRSPRSTASPATAARARATAPRRSRSIPSPPTGRPSACRTSRTGRSSGRSPPAAAPCRRGGTCPTTTAGRSSATSARSPGSDPEDGAVNGESGSRAVGPQTSLRATLAEMAEILESARERLREPPTDPGAEGRRLDHAAERDDHTLAIFQEILSVPPLGLPPGELFALAMDRLSRLLAADRALLFVLDDATGRLVARSARGFRREDVESLALDPGEGLIGRVFREKRVQTLDAAAAPEPADPFIERFPVRQGIAVPVRTEGEVGGVLFAGRRALGAPFSTTDMLLLLVIADRVGSALVHQHLLERHGEHLTHLREARALVDEQRPGREPRDLLARACEAACRLPGVRGGPGGRRPRSGVDHRGGRSGTAAQRRAGAGRSGGRPARGGLRGGPPARDPRSAGPDRRAARRARARRASGRPAGAAAHARAGAWPARPRRRRAPRVLHRGGRARAHARDGDRGGARHAARARGPARRPGRAGRPRGPSGRGREGARARRARRRPDPRAQLGLRAAARQVPAPARPGAGRVAARRARRARGGGVARHRRPAAAPGPGRGGPRGRRVVRSRRDRAGGAGLRAPADRPGCASRGAPHRDDRGPAVDAAGPGQRGRVPGSHRQPRAERDGGHARRWDGGGPGARDRRAAWSSWSRTAVGASRRT